MCVMMNVVAILYSSSLSSHRDNDGDLQLSRILSQSFIHQVLVPIFSLTEALVSEITTSQSFIHQVLVPIGKCICLGQ